MNSKDIIRVSNLKKSFGEKDVLKDLNFEIKRGEVYALLGHNGAGKTTTLRILLGLLNKNDGEVSVFGKDPYKSQSDVLKMCGVLSEDNGLYESLTVYENLKFFASSYGCFDSTFEDRIDTLLKSFDMYDEKHSIIKNFSLGMKKKTAIIRTLFHNPSIVMMDEPTNGLDPVSVEVLSKLIYEYSQKNKTTFILTTHNLDVVSKICSGVVIVKNGKNIFSTSLSHEKNELVRTKIKVIKNETVNIKSLEFKSHFEIEEDQITLFTDCIEEVASFVSTLVKHNIGVYEIDRNAFDLTSIYLNKDREEFYV